MKFCLEAEHNEDDLKKEDNLILYTVLGLSLHKLSCACLHRVQKNWVIASPVTVTCCSCLFPVEDVTDMKDN